MSSTFIETPVVVPQRAASSWLIVCAGGCRSALLKLEATPIGI